MMMESDIVWNLDCCKIKKHKPYNPLNRSVITITKPHKHITNSPFVEEDFVPGKTKTEIEQRQME